MMSKYDQLSDDEAIELAIEFVAREVTMPDELAARLERLGLLKLITA